MRLFRVRQAIDEPVLQNVANRDNFDRPSGMAGMLWRRRLCGKIESLWTRPYLWGSRLSRELACQSSLSWDYWPKGGARPRSCNYSGVTREDVLRMPCVRPRAVEGRARLPSWHMTGSRNAHFFWTRTYRAMRLRCSAPAGTTSRGFGPIRPATPTKRTLPERWRSGGCSSRLTRISAI